MHCELLFCVDSGYEGRKLKENVECEIFQTILDEARDSYREEIVHELPSNTPDDMESNISRALEWLKQNGALQNGV
jgi:adenylate kinase